MDKNPADDQLRAALAGNDPAAVELIWNRYASDLFAFLRAVLGSGHDAEDVLQAVFVRIVRKRHRLAGARRLDAYVYRIARNEASRLLGRRQRDHVAGVPPATRRRDAFGTRGQDGRDTRDACDTGSQSRNEASELAEELQAALERLPQPQREVIVMKIYRQKTFLEIAGLLGLSANTVASRYRYGMEKLRTLLGDITL